MRTAPRFNQVFARRWTLPILAQLAGTPGCKFITLANSLDGSRAALKASLELLEALDLVHPNPGFGHPLRPEYILSAKGRLISKPAAALVRSLERADLLDQGLRKWSLPTIHTINKGAARFAAIADALGSATDRAVSLALTDLHASSLVDRTLIPGAPPRNQYALTRRSKRFAPMLTDIHSALQ